MKIKKVKMIFITGVFLLSVILGNLHAQEQAGRTTRRLGLFIGSNNGGRDRVMLRYAVSDARSVSRVFTDMGGINQGDNYLIVEPAVSDINRHLDIISRELSSSRRNYQRTELVFYYSGHSDEDGLLLNRERYSYRDLREKINSLNTDMRVVILDSCSSGAITRAKGGVKTRPFLFDSSVSAEGYAFLTSSSENESSQESDSIESSYFTHSLVAGLRGAADTVGDGRVTLNEIYRFAYNETLAKTETSVYGAQHPSYDMQLSGSGDVILTDIRETSASLLIDRELTGRITIRDDSDFLIAELTKVNQNPMELGLSPGLYHITTQRGGDFYRAEVTLRENTRTPLAMSNFSRIASASGDRGRGDEKPEPPAEVRQDRGSPPEPEAQGRRTITIPLPDIRIRVPRIIGSRDGEKQEPAVEANPEEIGNLEEPGKPEEYQIQTKTEPSAEVRQDRGSPPESTTERANYYTFFYNDVSENFRAPLIGFINVARGDHNFLQAGFTNTNTGNFRGLQAGFVNTIDGSLYGMQAGFVNTTRKSVSGVQAGFINTNTSDTTGAQAGFVNTINGNFFGMQAGFINTLSDNLRGIQAGFVNSNAGSATGIKAGFVNIAAGDTRGIQAGFVNTTTGSSTGIQAGFVNIVSGDTRGIQAGFVNSNNGSTTGMQAGFVNIAKKGIKGGMQVGFVNYAESIENGFPIGFLSFVKNGGYRAVEYYFSEFNPVTIGLKTGIDKFYTSIYTAYTPMGETNNKYLRNHFALGYGIGTIIPIGKYFFINPELNDFHKFIWGEDDYYQNILSFVPSFGFQFGKRFSVTTGPSVTWLRSYRIQDGGRNSASLSNDVRPEPLFKIYGYDFNEWHSVVIGLRAAFRVHF